MNKRIFRGAILEITLLNLINNASDQGLHGYAMYGEFQKKFGVLLRPSTLYAELVRLEKQGLVDSSWGVMFGKARRVYRITRKGQARLQEYFIELKIVIPHALTPIHEC